MKERPILFSGPMVRAILEGKKTQTRRLVTVPGKGQKRRLPGGEEFLEQDGRLLFEDQEGDWHDFGREWGSPYAEVGDRLWVRETWQTTTTPADRDVSKLEYAADWNGDKPGFCEDEWTWRPSIFMPRWASRILLEVVAVRVERLQDITEEDARAEGLHWWSKDGVLRKWGLAKRHISGEHDHVEPWADLARSHAEAFERLWNQINGARAGADWASNPWVWVVTFKVVTEPAAEPKES